MAQAMPVHKTTGTVKAIDTMAAPLPNTPIRDLASRCRGCLLCAPRRTVRETPHR
jgi:hypothetical protein